MWRHKSPHRFGLVSWRHAIQCFLKVGPVEAPCQDMVKFWTRPIIPITVERALRLRLAVCRARQPTSRRTCGNVAARQVQPGPCTRSRGVDSCDGESHARVWVLVPVDGHPVVSVLHVTAQDTMGSRPPPHVQQQIIVIKSNVQQRDRSMHGLLNGTRLDTAKKTAHAHRARPQNSVKVATTFFESQPPQQIFVCKPRAQTFLAFWPARKRTA